MLEHEEEEEENAKREEETDDEIVVSTSGIEVISSSSPSYSGSVSAVCFPKMTSCDNNYISVPCRVRRRCLISNPQPCDDTPSLSFEGNAIPMICSISPPWASDQTESFTPELLLQPQLQALPQRMPLLIRRGHENTTAGSGSSIRPTGSISSRSSSKQTKASTRRPPREIAISVVPPDPKPAAMNYYRIPLRGILLVDTTLSPGGNTASEPGTTASSLSSSSHTFVVILPTHALELDCISRNSYCLILACLEAFIKKSNIRKVKKSKKTKKNLLLPGKNRNGTTNTATGMTTISSCGGGTSSILATTYDSSSAAKSNTSNTSGTEILNMMMYSSNCSSADALTDHIMFLAAESESLVDKLGRRIGKCMADISETLLMQ